MYELEKFTWKLNYNSKDGIIQLKELSLIHIRNLFYAFFFFPTRPRPNILCEKMHLLLVKCTKKEIL